MLISLHQYNGKTAQFKILPRYKVKAEGEYVQIHDQVIFESFKSGGHYFHASAPWNIERNLFGSELNLGVSMTGFTVVRHHRPVEAYKGYIRGGAVVRLFHKDLEAYLVAEGRFNSEISEDVHLRIREIDQFNAKTLSPPTSGITYWQIELEESILSGDIIRWEQRIRLRHLTTRLYMCVDTNQALTLTEDENDPRSVFSLHPVLSEALSVPYESYCRIQHVLTGSWLHANNEQEYVRKRLIGHENDKTMKGLQWDGGEVRSISPTTNKNYVDVFTIQRTEDKLVKNFNFVAGMVPFLCKLIESRSQYDTLNAMKTHQTVTVLKEIKEFMIVEGEFIKERQKLLRNLQAVDLLVQLLQCPLNNVPDKIYLMSVFKEAYDILHTYMKGHSRKNALYFAKYIAFFQTQLNLKGEIGLNVAHMLVELIKDNRKIVDRITHQQIDLFVELLRQRKNYRFLDLLNVLCVCDGVAIPDNQNYVVDVWLKDCKEDVYLTERGQYLNREHNVVYLSTNVGQSWIPLHDFVNVNHHSFDENSYAYLDRQLDLLGKLCYGRNIYSIRAITKDLDILTWENTFFCMKSEVLPADLRAKYCNLIVDIFVDVGVSSSVLDRHLLCYIYEDIDNPRPLYSIKKPVNQELATVFPVLRDWIEEFITRNNIMYLNMVGQNKLIEQVCRLLCFLVKFGCYNDPNEIRRVLKPTLVMIDGRHDCPFPRKKGDSKDVKKLYKHYREHDRFQPSPENKVMVDAKFQALKVLELLFAFQVNTRLMTFVSKFKTAVQTSMMKKKKHHSVLVPLLNENYDAFGTSRKQRKSQKKILKELHEMFDNSSYFDKETIKTICLDLANYKYDKMLTQALSVMNRFYSSCSDLFKVAVQGQMLTTQESLNVNLDVERQMPVLRQLSRSKANEESAEMADKILALFTSCCHLRGWKSIRHPLNQTLLCNQGLLSVIFDILTQKIDMTLLDQYTEVEAVFKRTLHCLRFLAQGNEEVQEKIFEKLDSLLCIKVVVSDVALALKEAFTGNQNNCLRILPDQLHRIISLIGEYQADAPELLDLLSSIVKVEGLDLPLKRNQGLVINYLMQNYHRAVYLFDWSEDERLKLLTDRCKSEHQDYLIRLVNLLASCAEGENRYIESLCQTIMSIEEILVVLNNQFIDSNHKTPYLRYLIWVYMRTAGTMIESGAGDLPHDKEVWNYMDTLVAEAERITAFVAENRDVTIRMMAEPPDRVMMSDIGDQQLEVHGSLYYFFEAVLPFLQTFFTKFYSPDQDNFPDEVEHVDRLSSSLVTWCDAVGGLLSSSTHLKRMIGCIPSIMSTSSLPKNAMENFIEKYGSGDCLHDLSSDAVQTYEVYYKDEEDLNSKFSIFAINCSLVYGGDNTVAVQLKYKRVNREYTDIGGDQELPLGGEFQAHVQCFVDGSAKNTVQKYSLPKKLVEQLAAMCKRITSKEDIPFDDARQDQDELDIKTLQLLRAIVHNEERKLPADYEDNTAKKSVRKQFKVIENVQNILDDHQAVINVIPLLGRQNDNIIREVLAFISIMLFNANKKVQKSMLTYFLSTKKESFFYAIRSRLQLAAVSIKERRALAAQHEARLKEAETQAKSLQMYMTVGKKAMQDIKAWETKTSNKKRSSMFGSRHYSLAASTLSLHNGKKRPLPNRHNSMVSLVNGSIKSGYHIKSDRVPLFEKKNAIELTDMNQKETYENIQMESIVATPEVDSVLEDLAYKDEGNIRLVLRVLAAMCDGQNKTMQDYLRTQPDNIKSINVVAETAQFLNVVYSNISESTVDLVTQLIETLTEFTQGNQQNRVVVLDNKVVDYINFILRAGKTEGCSTEKYLCLQSAISDFVNCLVEENGPEPLLIAQEVKDTIDKEALFRLMTECFSSHQPNTKSHNKTGIDGAAKGLAMMGTGFIKGLMEGSTKNELKELMSDVGFKYYILLQRFYDIDPHMETRLGHPITAEQREAFSYYKKNSMSVEILKDGFLQKVNFRVKNKNVLREEVKEKLKWSVDRSSPTNKIRDLMEWSKDILKDIYYQRKILRNPLAVFFTKFWLLWNYLCIFLSLTINVIMLVTWEAPASLADSINGTLPHDINSPDPKTPIFPDYPLVLYGLGGGHNLFSLFVLISYFLSNHPTFPNWRNISKSISSYCGKKESDQEDELSDEEPASKLDVSFFSFSTLYYLIFVGTSAAGTAFHGYFFAFHLLNVVNNNQLLQGVIKAVTQNGRSLLWVGILGMIIFYLYALISFAFLRFVYDPSNQVYCATLWQCTVTVIRYGLIGDLFENLPLTGDSNTFLKFALMVIFHVSFFIFITTIGLNVIFGIIVDTFSELRDLKWTAERDMRDTCFICSRPSHDFEHNGLGFEHHAMYEHNMWAYMFYLIRLDDIASNDYTALDMHVSTLLKKESYDFFPMNQALSLSGKGHEDATDEKIDEVLKRVEELLRRQREEESRKIRDEEKRRKRKWQENHKFLLSRDDDDQDGALPQHFIELPEYAVAHQQPSSRDISPSGSERHPSPLLKVSPIGDIETSITPPTRPSSRIPSKISETDMVGEDDDDDDDDDNVDESLTIPGDIPYTDSFPAPLSPGQLIAPSYEDSQHDHTLPPPPPET